MMELEVCIVAIMSVVGIVVGETQYRPETQLRAKYPLQRNQHIYCTKAQSNIDFHELLGLWNVIELIEHSDRYNDRRNYLRGVRSRDSCPIVHFSISPDEDREVRMVWNDETGYIQYNFRLPNINNPGFWLSLGYQTGDLVDDEYQHFGGTAQVMKAVQSHMVLTFCSPHERHFSIILARTKYLSQEEIRGVHKQLSRVNLPLVAVQGYCSNSAASLVASALVFILAALTTLTTHH